MEGLEDIINRFGRGEELSENDFEEITPGRWFEKKRRVQEGVYEFFVVLGPNKESPVHNHKGEDMAETHQLREGSGKFEIYDKNGEITEVLELVQGVFHKIFSTADTTPDHKYIAGPMGSICLA